MSQTDAPRVANFLPDSYAERVEDIESALQLLEPQPDAGVSVNSQMTTCILTMARSMGSHGRFIQREAKGLPRDPHATAQGRERLLQLHGFMSAYIDASLELSTDMAAMITGDMEVHDSDNAVLGYEAGEEIIVSRARHTASSLLRATDVLYQGYDDAPDSLWDRANSLHRSRKVKASPNIKNREFKEFGELRRAALETPVHTAPAMPFKPSRFTFVTLFRAAKAARVQLPNGQETPGVDMLEKSKELTNLASVGQPEALELTPAQIAQAMATVTKVLKHVRNAGRADRSIATDPSVRFLSFMVAKLSGGYAVGSEMAAYRRRAEQTATQLRQFA